MELAVRVRNICDPYDRTHDIYVYPELLTRRKKLIRSGKAYQAMFVIEAGQSEEQILNSAPRDYEILEAGLDYLTLLALKELQIPWTLVQVIQ